MSRKALYLIVNATTALALRFATMAPAAYRVILASTSKASKTNSLR
jgi:hypothetical protein